MKRPKVNPARSKSTKSTSVTSPLEATEQKDDLLICDLWHNGKESVYGMRVVNTDANFHSAKTRGKCLQEAERAKKKMYLEACLQQFQHSLPFFSSVNELLGVEEMYTLKRIASRLASKWRKPYSRMCRYVNSRISITFEWDTHCWIRGSGVPAHNINV